MVCMEEKNRMKTLSKAKKVAMSNNLILKNHAAR